MDGTMLPLFDLSNSTLKHFQILIYLDPASTGSESFTAKLEIRRYVDDQFFEIESQTTTGAATKRVIEFNYRSAKGFKCSLQQTGGTMRIIKWEVHSL